MKATDDLSQGADDPAKAHRRRLNDAASVTASTGATSPSEDVTQATLQECQATAKAELFSLRDEALATERERHFLEGEREALRAREVLLHGAEQAAETARLAAEHEAAQLQALSGVLLQAARLLQRASIRYPWLTRQARRAARVVWWTLRGKLFERLRARRQARDERRVALPRFPSHLLKPAWLSGDVPLSTMPMELRSRDGSKAAPATFWAGADGARPAPTTEVPDDAPLVSVVVTSFNYGDYLETAVDSVLAQTFKNLEIIVVEGGSTDPASRLVAANLRRPRTQVLMQDAPHGVGANRNLGIAHAKGRYICCLDADDTLAPTYIEKAVFLLERHGYDVVSSGQELVGEQTGTITILERPDLSAVLEGNHVLTSAVFRRAFWVTAGGYRDMTDPGDGHVHEDWAFWVRLAALGARFRNLSQDPMLRYRVHGLSLSRRSDVLPMDQQRKMVRHMNADVLKPEIQTLARSGALASRESGTPIAPPADIRLELGAPECLGASDRGSLLLAVPYLVLGGAERLLSSVVGHLTAQGWRVVIVTSLMPSAEQGDANAWFERHTQEIFHLPRGLPPALWEDFLHHLIRSRGIDLLWIAGSAFAYDCLRSLRAAHPALHVVDLLFNTIGHTANNRRRRELIDVTFVENNEVLSWLSARAASGEQFRLVSSGVDVSALAPVPRNSALIQQIGASEADLIVGFAGRWSEEKNPLGFVEIARLVDAAMPVKFVMIGAGPLRTAIEAAIRKAGFAKGRFHLLGEVPDPVPIMGSLDILVVPSVLDGRPMAILESLSLGVPVLASRVGGIPELIQHGRTGWLHDPRDLHDFAATIVGAQSDRDELGKMRRHAREFAEARLDVKDMLEGYRRELTRLLLKDLGRE